MRYIVGLLASLCALAQTAAVTIPDTSRFGLTVTSCTMDAAGKMCAMVLRVPKTGTISKVWVATGAVTTAADLSISLQTVSTTDGFPTGTNYGGSSPGTIAAPTGNTWYEVTLGAAASATAGDVVAVVVAFASSVGNLTIRYYTSSVSSFGYAADYTTAWAKRPYTPIVALVYSDGSVVGVHDAMPIISSIIYFNANSTPDERGIYFKSPVTGKVSSLSFFGSLASGANFDVVLYDQGNNVLASISVLASQATSAAGPFTFPVVSLPAINVGSWYRLTLKPATGANVGVYQGVFPNAVVRDGYFKEVYGTYRTDGGPWSEDQSVVYRLWLMVTDISSSGGGGSCGGSVVVCY